MNSRQQKQPSVLCRSALFAPVALNFFPLDPRPSSLDSRPFFTGGNRESAKQFGADQHQAETEFIKKNAPLPLFAPVKLNSSLRVTFFRPGRFIIGGNRGNGGRLGWWNDGRMGKWNVGTRTDGMVE